MHRPIRIIRNDKSFKFYEWLYRKNVLGNQKKESAKDC